MTRLKNSELFPASRRISRRSVLGKGGAGAAAGALAITGFDPRRGTRRSDSGDGVGRPDRRDRRDPGGPALRPSRLGLYVADRATGETVYDIRGDEWFLAASTTKLFPGAAALDAYGPDYRFETPIYRTGAVGADGALDGDLILVASGDLTMGGRDTAGRRDRLHPDRPHQRHRLPRRW